MATRPYVGLTAVPAPATASTPSPLEDPQYTGDDIDFATRMADSRARQLQAGATLGGRQLTAYRPPPGELPGRPAWRTVNPFEGDVEAPSAAPTATPAPTTRAPATPMVRARPSTTLSPSPFTPADTRGGYEPRAVPVSTLEERRAFDQAAIQRQAGKGAFRYSAPLMDKTGSVAGVAVVPDVPYNAGDYAAAPTRPAYRPPQVPLSPEQQQLQDTMLDVTNRIVEVRDEAGRVVDTYILPEEQYEPEGLRRYKAEIDQASRREVRRKPGKPLPDMPQPAPAWMLRYADQYAAQAEQARAQLYAPGEAMNAPLRGYAEAQRRLEAARLAEAARVARNRI